MIRLPSWQGRENRQAPPAASVPVENSGLVELDRIADHVSSHVAHAGNKQSREHKELDNFESYLLNNGRWYRIDSDFVDEVDNACAKIPRWTVPLPDYDVKGEGAYNSFVAETQPSEFQLMDQNLIMHGGGSSKIELCDLYHKSKALVHVKRYGGSSTLSHLFAQGRISGEIFKTDPAFRSKVGAELTGAFHLSDPDRAPSEAEYSIVFAVISDSDGDELLFPFFSRLNLRHTYRNLTGYGYQVFLAKIRAVDTD